VEGRVQRGARCQYIEQGKAQPTRDEHGPVGVSAPEDLDSRVDRPTQ